MYIEHRDPCVQQISEPITTSNGVEIHDILRFFHGDNPSQQQEAGHNMGGWYPCVMCGAHAKRFDDLSHCYRCDTITIADRQQFMLAGTLWKENRPKLFENLKVVELRAELSSRGINTDGKLRQELHKELESLRKGIANFPALLRQRPESSLEEANLSDYEISGVEPLHDFKGHMCHIFKELPHILSQDGVQEVTKIKETVLNKDTLRCVDYRKAVLLLSQGLRNVNVDEDIQKLVDTAVEICEILYSRDSERTPRTILRLHNLTYIHGTLCENLLSKPVVVTNRRIFGNYYHALTCHSAMMYRVISLRSLNTEYQERMFGQANSITKQTSNNHPQHIIDNAVIRMQAEASRTMATLKQQEGEVSRLAKSFQHLPNSYFNQQFIENHSLQFQSHLERISDFLLLGPGVWWKNTSEGIEFLDGPNEEATQNLHTVEMLHFRSTKAGDIQASLLKCWEECITKKVPLPLKLVGEYDPSGDLLTSDEESDDEDEDASNDDNGHDLLDIHVHTQPSTCTSVTETGDTSVASEQSSRGLHTVKTKLGKALLDIEVSERLVIQFDNCRKRIKSLKASSRTVKSSLQTQYKTLSYKVKNEIIKIHRENSKAISSYKESTNDAQPYPANITVAKRIVKLCNQILMSEWKQNSMSL